MHLPIDGYMPMKHATAIIIIGTIAWAAKVRVDVLPGQAVIKEVVLSKQELGRGRQYADRRSSSHDEIYLAQSLDNNATPAGWAASAPPVPYKVRLFATNLRNCGKPGSV